MFENANLPRVVRVKSTVPVTDELEVFDMMSRFLASEKAKQLSHDFAGQAYLASSSQIWNDLRLACNSLLEQNDPRREPVAPWKEQLEETTGSVGTPVSVKEESSSDDDSDKKMKEKSESDIIKSEKKSAKKAKKEAKKMKKAAKKAAKKEKKEKKRKREEEES